TGPSIAAVSSRAMGWANATGVLLDGSIRDRRLLSETWAALSRARPAISAGPIMDRRRAYQARSMSDQGVEGRLGIGEVHRPAGDDRLGDGEGDPRRGDERLQR